MTTQAERVEALMEMHDNAAEARHLSGSPLYNKFSQVQRNLVKDSITALVAENETLSRKNAAQDMLIKAKEAQLSHVRTIAEVGAEAARTLQSEREANAILTAENESLRADADRLRESAERERERLEMATRMAMISAIGGTRTEEPKQ